MSEDILSRLYEVLKDRKGGDPAESYVASLYHKGPEKIGRKVLEEAGEVLVEAAKGDAENIRSESADLLFHLMVLWADQGITPQDIFAILEERFGIGGHAEKSSR